MVPTNDHSAGTFPHDPIGAMLGMNNSSSSSPPVGSDQRLPGRLSGSTNLLFYGNGSNFFTPCPIDDHNAVVRSPPRIASAAGHGGNNSSSNNNNNRYNNNQNVSLDLSLQPYGSQNGSSSPSVPSAITSTGGAPEQGGGDGGSSNTAAARRMPFKRTPDYAFREFVVGESSSAGVAEATAGVPKRRAANENVQHTAATCTCTTCPLHGSSGGQHENGTNNAGRGGNSWSITEVQQALQAESFSSNIDLQAANSQAFVQPNMLSSMGYMRSDSHVPLPGQQAPLSFYQQSFFSHAETSPVSTFCSGHPFENLRDSQYTPSWTNIMRPRNAPSVSFPLRSVMGGSGSGSEVVAPFQGARNNVSGSFMINPRIGRANWVQNPANSSLASNGNNANFLGSYSHASSSSNNQHRSVVAPAFHQLSNIARAWIQRLNVHEEYLRISSGSVPPSDPSQQVQVNLSAGLGNPIVENEHRPVAGAENQAGGNNNAPLPSYIADPNRLREEVYIFRYLSS